MIWRTSRQHRPWHVADVQPSSVGMKESKKEWRVLHTDTQRRDHQCSHALHEDPLPLLPGRFDHLVVIERTGRAADGSHYNARKMNFKHLVNPIDDLFLAARKIPGISSTGKQGALRVRQEDISAKSLFIDCWTQGQERVIWGPSFSTPEMAIVYYSWHGR